MLTNGPQALNCAQSVAAKRRRRQKRLTACPMRHYRLHLSRHGCRVCMFLCWAVTCPGLLSCKPQVKEFRGDKSSQLLLLMKHHQAIPSDYRNAKPLAEDVVSLLEAQSVPTPLGQGGNTSVAGGPGLVQTQNTPPPPQELVLGEELLTHHILGRLDHSTVPPHRASSSVASALQYGVQITHSCSVAI